MLRAIPNGLLSWNFTIFDGDDLIANIDFAWVREEGELHLKGSDCRVFREGFLSGDFILEQECQVFARARKTSAMTRSYQINHYDKTFTLEAEFPMMRGFVLRDGGQTIGSVRPEHAFTRKAIVELPEDIALPVRVFMIWLTLLMWKRNASAE